jgi:plasmid stabilization system protein ParE
MQVRWTPAAADDLENIANYLFEKTPENAPRLIREIYRTPSRLKNFPNRGREGKKERHAGIGDAIPAVRLCVLGWI